MEIFFYIIISFFPFISIFFYAPIILIEIEKDRKIENEEKEIIKKML